MHVQLGIILVCFWDADFRHLMIMSTATMIVKNSTITTTTGTTIAIILRCGSGDGGEISEEKNRNKITHCIEKGHND